MARSSNKQIAEDAQTIIRELMEDSRQSPHEIAEKCGFSRQKVWRVINKLDEEKKIWGYTAVVDDNADGSNTYFALGRVKAPLFNVIDQIIEIVKGDKSRQCDVRLLGTYYVNGLYDWLVIFSAQNMIDAKRFCGYIQKEYDTYLDRIDLMESVFPLIKFGKINSNIEQLKEFAIS